MTSEKNALRTKFFFARNTNCILILKRQSREKSEEILTQMKLGNTSTMNLYQMNFQARILYTPRDLQTAEG